MTSGAYEFICKVQVSQMRNNPLIVSRASCWHQRGSWVEITSASVLSDFGSFIHLSTFLPFVSQQLGQNTVFKLEMFPFRLVIIWQNHCNDKNTLRFHI